jgi:hypothetical protein
MKSESLTKAYDTYVECEKQLRMAHTDAIEAEDQFAEILIFQILEKMVEVDWRLKRMAEAAK